MTLIRCVLIAGLALGCVRGTANAQSGSWAEVNGARLYYERSGTGPDVILIHGFSLDHRMWQPQVAALSAAFRVTRYDVRGFGQSSPVTSTHDAVADLRGLMDHLDIRRAHIVGMSMGGTIAADFVLTHPDRAATLVLVGGGVSGAPLTGAAERLGAIFRLGADSGVTAAKDRWLRDHFLTPVHDTAAVRKLVRSIVLQCSCPHLAKPELFPQEAAPPAFGRLEDIRVPILAITGDADDPDVLAVAEAIERRVPGARRLRIANAGHLANLEQPATINAGMFAFFKEHP